MSVKVSPEFREVCENKLTELLVASNMAVKRGTHPECLIIDGHQPGQRKAICIDGEEMHHRVAIMQQALASETEMVSCVTFVSEAWTFVGPADINLEKLIEQYGSLENVPGHSEVVIFSFMYGAEQMVATCPIKRGETPEGTIVERGDLMDPSEGFWGGGFVNQAHDAQTLN